MKTAKNIKNTEHYPNNMGSKHSRFGKEEDT